MPREALSKRNDGAKADEIMGFWSVTGKVLGFTAKVSAKATLAAGKAATKATVNIAKTAYEHRERIGKAAAAAAETAVTAAAVVGYGAYKATEWTAKKAYDHREDIGGAVHGAAVGTAGAIADASGHFVDLKTRFERVKEQSDEYRRRSKTLWERLARAEGNVSRRDVLLDTLAVGGATLASYIDGSALPPAEVEAAFRAAYPDLAASEDFASAVRRMSADELPGFASGVKGKLFEIEYVEYLNDGHLPAGYSAQLAGSATQAGWDIQVLGPDAQVAELIQAKATDSVAYVSEALRRYPDIDVVTTSEVHAELMMKGLADRVVDSGLSEVALQATVDAAADTASIQFDWMPSSIALALIAFSSYSKEGLDEYARSKNFGERASKSYLAYLAGGVVAVATQTWWIGLIGGMGTRLLIGKGRRKWDQKAQLDQLIASNDRVLARLPHSD